MQWRLRLFLYPSPRERAGVRVIPQGQRKPEQVGWEKRSGSHRKDFTLEERWEPPQRLKNTFQNPSLSYSHPTFTLSSGEGRGEGCPAGQRKSEQVGWEKRSGSHRKEQSSLSSGEGRGEGCPARAQPIFAFAERWEPPQGLKNTFQNPCISYSHPTWVLLTGF